MPGADEFSLAAYVLFAAIISGAGLVHGAIGLGFPLVSTPLLALIVDVRSAILITLLPTVTVNVASIIRGGHWGESIGRYWPLGVYALLGGILGTTLIIVNDPAPFKLVLALLVLLYLASDRMGALNMSWVPAHRNLSMLLFGLVAGVSAGSTNVMVPILIIYALEMGLRTTAMVQVFNMCFLAGKVAQMIAFAWSGMLNLELLTATAPLAVIALAALFVGMTLRDRLAGDAYRNVIKAVLLVVAVLLIAQFFLGR